eukprot:m.442073 g.442073  ORF g.442073 m.442073 type:complete len:50 (+) comp129637_c0_seq1:123-272(+)
MAYEWFGGWVQSDAIDLSATSHPLWIVALEGVLWCHGVRVSTRTELPDS